MRAGIGPFIFFIQFARGSILIDPLAAGKPSLPDDGIEDGTAEQDRPKHDDK